MRTCGCDSPCLENGFGIRRGAALHVKRARPVLVPPVMMALVIHNPNLSVL